MARTTSQSVLAVLPLEVPAGTDMTAFITPASLLVDYVATKDTAGILTAAMLTQIETYVAAHLYARRDPQYQSKTTGKASAVFQGQTGLRLDGTHWGQDAMVLDVTGCLAALNKGKTVVQGLWLGKAPSDQIDYEDRD